MIFSAFPGTPTSALETLLNITPINEFIMAETVKRSYRMSCLEYWPANAIGVRS